MATAVQRWAALCGALLNTDTPDAALQTEVAEACCQAQGYAVSVIATMTNAQKAQVALQDFNEFGRLRLRAALEPARETAKQNQLTADVNAKLPGT